MIDKPAGLPVRVAAGGVVVRQHDGIQVALVQDAKHDGYILPKGAVELGENLETAARREILEEAGFTNLTLLGKLGVCERRGSSGLWWSKTHFFLFLTLEEQGRPEEAWRYKQPHWFPLNALPPLRWSEQEALLSENRETIERLVNDA